MAESGHRATLWAIAATALVAGCVLTAIAAKRLSSCRAAMERRASDHLALSELDARVRHMETALVTWQERTPGPPAPVSVLATNIFGESKVEMRELASSNAAPGSLVRTVELVCQDAPFDRAMQLVQRFDGLWPRWVLVHMELKSSDQPGRGRITMRFESISAPDAGPVVLVSRESERFPASPPAKTSGGAATQETRTIPPASSPRPQAQPGLTSPGSPAGWSKPEGVAPTP